MRLCVCILGVSRCVRCMSAGEHFCEEVRRLAGERFCEEVRRLVGERFCEEVRRCASVCMYIGSISVCEMYVGGRAFL